MSNYHLGLDFGTTNSIISYLDRDTPTVYKYGAPGHQEEYIPSFIAYEDDYIDIGGAARLTTADNPQVESYGNFKMRLPEGNSNGETETQRRDAIQITSDYLRQLLTEGLYSFRQQQGDIAGLVVSVPEIWQRDIYNLGRERLQKLIRDDLGLPLIQLVSEPVAAAAYYAWETAQRTSPFQGNLLVCDMGGGTFDVSLCRIYGDKKVEVLYFDGQGDRGLESAGVAFDRRCVEKAYLKKHDCFPDPNSGEFMQLLQQFEQRKISQHGRMQKKFKNYLRSPDSYNEQNAYTFAGGYTVTFAEVREAFAPIEAGIQRVMGRVTDWLQQHDLTFDRLSLVGGFSQFPLVHHAISESLNIEDSDPRFDRQFNLAKSAYAIAYGSCLIANKRVDPTEKYVHTLGIVIGRELHRSTQESTITEESLTLVEGGTSLDQLNEPQFFEEPLVAWTSSFPVPIWVDPVSRGKVYKKETPDRVTLPNHSPSAEYRVGMSVDRSQVAYLVIEEIHSNERIKYELGNLIAEMFPGFILRDDRNGVSA